MWDCKDLFLFEYEAQVTDRMGRQESRENTDDACFEGTF